MRYCGRRVIAMCPPSRPWYTTPMHSHSRLIIYAIGPIRDRDATKYPIAVERVPQGIQVASVGILLCPGTTGAPDDVAIEVFDESIEGTANGKIAGPNVERRTRVKHCARIEKLKRRVSRNAQRASTSHRDVAASAGGAAYAREYQRLKTSTDGHIPATGDENTAFL